jgi:transcriptional antiterminator
MVKETRKQTKKDARRAATIKETAELAGVSTRTVQRVLNADQENEAVLSIFMEIKERHEEILKEVGNWMTIFNRPPKATTN